MKRKIICVTCIACILAIGLLAGCKEKNKEQQNAASSKEVQLDSTNMPLEISADVDKRLDNSRIKVKVLKDGGGYTANDEVIVEYNQVVIAHGDEAVRDIGTEEYEVLPEEGSHVLVTYWEKEKKREEGEEILAGSQITIQENRDSAEILQALKKKIDNISISYVSLKNTEKEKKLTDKEKIGKFLDELQTSYNVLEYQLDAYEIQDFQGYCVTIREGEKEYGVIKVNNQGECEWLVKRQLPWRQAYYKADKNLYQWIEAFYNAL